MTASHMVLTAVKLAILVSTYLAQTVWRIFARVPEVKPLLVRNARQTETFLARSVTLAPIWTVLTTAFKIFVPVQTVPRIQDHHALSITQNLVMNVTQDTI